MQIFKITCTCLLMVLISCLSVAKPLTQAETSPQKIEQIDKKKRTFAERIFHKRFKKADKINEDPETLSKICLWLGILALPITLVPLIGSLGSTFALGAIIIGAIGKKKYSDKTTKYNKRFRIGMILGIIALAIYTILIGIFITALAQAAVM